MNVFTIYSMRFLSLLCRADFMQMMILSTMLFLLPLNKRQHWKWRLLLIAIPALIISVTLTMFVAANEWTFEISVLYYPAPLIASVLIFRVCSQEPLQDAVYGMGCAYASQHIAFCVITILWGEHWITLASPLLIGSWLVQTALLLLCWCFFARTLPVDGAYAVSWRKALLHTGIVIFIAMILNRIVRSVWQSADLTSYNISLAYDLCSCLFILVLQLEQRKELNYRAMVETERRLRWKAQEQYDLSRENIDIINRKCHDLKHQVSALRFVSNSQQRESSLREIEELVMIYDTATETGNKVLDTVLTEKALLCEENHISYTCMADRKLLDFMSPVDLYIIMGNALDNAIESSRNIPSIEQRVVRVTVRASHGAAFIQVENYYDHPILSGADGLATTKADPVNHGFGLQSIRSITERYGGALDIETENGKFLLSILIPLPEQKNIT